MYEFDKYDRDLHSTPPASPQAPYAPAGGIDRASLLVWGEHCIECAAPGCYKSCDLYDPRRDGGCRRFEYGFAKNRSFPSARGYGAEIVFKKWGKLEAPGNARLIGRSRLRWLERLLEWPVALVNNTGILIWRATGKVLFPRLSYALLESRVRKAHRDIDDLPDAFLVELYNPGPQPIVLQISIWSKLDLASRPAPYIERLEIPTGYFRRDIPAARFAQVVESGAPFNVSITPEGDATPHLVVLTLDFVKFKDAPQPAVKPDAKPDAKLEGKMGGKQPGVKCVVFDLDNTLWDGTLLEDSNVTLRPGVVETIKALDQRGILLSVASKNPHDLAWSKLGDFGLQDYFLYPAINWSPKSQNIKETARKLNIGLDTFVFIDNSSFEREEVSKALPVVEALDPADHLDGLLDHPRLRGSSSSEARNRRRFYQDAIVRDGVMAGFGDYIEFLRSCEIVLEIRPYMSADRQRTEELVQRTNQLNFSGRRYERSQLAEIVADQSLDKWVLSCSDKFGSYGVIGFCVSRRLPGEVLVEDLMLSCRIQGKFLEQALFSFLVRQHPAKTLRVNFRKTKSNGAAYSVLTQAGLSEVPEGFVLDMSNGVLTCDFIQLAGEATAVA